MDRAPGRPAARARLAVVAQAAFGAHAPGHRHRGVHRGGDDGALERTAEIDRQAARRAGSERVPDPARARGPVRAALCRDPGKKEAHARARAAAQGAAPTGEGSGRPALGIREDRDRERQHRPRRAGLRRNAGILHAHQSRPRQRPGLHTAKENDFELVSNESMRGIFDNLATMVTIASAFMCFLSLIVGGIGVMNIMLVAVTERTREIGLRKALGARRMRILMQFVIEAVFLAAFGGAIGVALGYCASWVGRLLTFPSQVPLWAVGLGIGVSCGVGLVAGIYPAWRASRLDPAVALRDE